MDIRRTKTRRVDALQVIKEIFYKIKSIDPIILLVPICDQGLHTNYINDANKLPRDTHLLDYLSHSISKN